MCWHTQKNLGIHVRLSIVNGQQCISDSLDFHVVKRWQQVRKPFSRHCRVSGLIVNLLPQYHKSVFECFHTWAAVMSCKPLALSTGHKKYLMQMNRLILLQSHITEESSGMFGPQVPQKALQVGLFPGSHPAFHGLQYRWQLTQWHKNHRGRELAPTWNFCS